MSKTDFGDPELKQLLLYEGWRLHERLEFFANQGFNSSLSERTTRNIAEWRKTVAPHNESSFFRRLEWDQLSPSLLACALDPPGTSSPKDPAWYKLLDNMCQAVRYSCLSSSEKQHNSLDGRGNQHPFVHAWRPAASWALDCLKERCIDLEEVFRLSQKAWLDVAEALLHRLCHVSAKALWEQFNQRRSIGVLFAFHIDDTGNHKRKTTNEAYLSFIRDQHASGYGLLLSSYPVLGRLLSEAVSQWLDTTELMLRRIATNWTDLRMEFSLASSATLKSVQPSLSDRHRGGHTVAILYFEAGKETQRIVYKPKDLRVDSVYQVLLRKVNTASTLEPLRSLSILSCNGYGFMEFIEHQICKNDAELRGFYYNTGRLLAILYILGCTDCHYQNLIACKEQLVLIDTETLFEADWIGSSVEARDVMGQVSELQESIKDSVLRTGLLPRWMLVGDGRKQAYDVSALGIDPPPAESVVDCWLDLNSDGMMAGRRSKPSELPSSLPVGFGHRHPLRDNIEELCNGFSAQMGEVIRLRVLILEALEGFRGKPRRFVARNTRVYYLVQSNMLEAAALQTSVSHGIQLEQLARSYVISSRKPINWPLLEAERRQMEQLDIPFFEHLIDSKRLPLDNGLPSIENYIQRSGFSASQDRISRINHDEVVFQRELIHGAVSARFIDTGFDETNSNIGSPLHHLRAPSESLSAGTYIQESRRIAEELWLSGIHGSHGGPEWLGVDVSGDAKSFHFGLVGQSLFSGSSGIALLFARLAMHYKKEGDLSQMELWMHRARLCFSELDTIAAGHSGDLFFRLIRDLPLGIVGSGGILLSLLLLKRAGLRDVGKLSGLLIEQIRPERLLMDECLDVMQGVSGLIGPLLIANTLRSNELAVICGQRILDLQLDCGGWPQNTHSPLSRPPLTGFSHGASGMSAALARLAKATAEKRFSVGAQKANSYERSVFDAKRCNWPDFRMRSTSYNFRHGWCHGAPGIMLSRILQQRCGIADDCIQEELKTAHSSTISALNSVSRQLMPPSNICCGIMGLAALLRISALTTGLSLSSDIPSAESLLVSGASKYGGYNLLSMGSISVKTPGLFTGKAGIGLVLLEAVTGISVLPEVLSAGLF